MRVVDRRKEPFTRYIGRGSDFGNPFTHLQLTSTKALVHARTYDGGSRKMLQAMGYGKQGMGRRDSTGAT